MRSLIIKKGGKLSALVLSFFIFALLLLSGPAQAFTLSLEADKTVAEQGKKITFTASIDINSGERLPIEEIVLVLEGPETVECSFDITGKMKAGVNEECYGINIKKIPLPQIEESYGYGSGDYNGYSYNFGYGYGYTEGKLEYEITLHTQKFSIGTYKTRLDVVIDGNIFSKDGPDITITQKTKGR